MATRKILQIAAVAAMVLLGFRANAAPDPKPTPISIPPLPEGAKPQPIAFTRLITTIEEGRQWLTFKSDFFHCNIDPTVHTLTWHSRESTFSSQTYSSPITDELLSSGFTISKNPSNLFQNRYENEDLELAGNIKTLNVMICMQKARYGEPSIHGNTVDFTIEGSPGDISLDIDWQIYSKRHGEIVLDKTIHAIASVHEHAPGSLERLIREGIRENVRTLIASDEFRKIVLAPVAKPDVGVSQQTRLPLPGSLGAKPAKISEAIGSVVLVLSGGGHGSGFLASTDGYLLTAQHVVGSDKYVKVRWSDGLEGLGEVIRTDKRRDVALIRTDSRGRAPLALRREAPEQGETVFAIGAPLDPTLQGTVTRGVASANRIIDGFSFIQSDVTVNPGNSGGPLLNEKGEVLGITDLALRERGETPTGLNFFVPVRDALDFLSLEQR